MHAPELKCVSCELYFTVFPLNMQEPFQNFFGIEESRHVQQMVRDLMDIRQIAEVIGRNTELVRAQGHEVLHRKMGPRG
jgi:hypothetical protein